MSGTLGPWTCDHPCIPERWVGGRRPGGENVLPPQRRVMDGAELLP